jgi:predicted NAD/FAD-binding protein
VDANRTSFCGAYWRNGFHEDGVVSALAVVEALQSRPPRLDREPGSQIPASFAVEHPR